MGKGVDQYQESNFCPHRTAETCMPTHVVCHGFAVVSTVRPESSRACCMPACMCHVWQPSSLYSGSGWPAPAAPWCRGCMPMRTLKHCRWMDMAAPQRQTDGDTQYTHQNSMSALLLAILLCSVWSTAVSYPSACTRRYAITLMLCMYSTMYIW